MAMHRCWRSAGDQANPGLARTHQRQIPCQPPALSSAISPKPRRLRPAQLLKISSLNVMRLSLYLSVVVISLSNPSLAQAGEIMRLRAPERSA